MRFTLYAANAHLINELNDAGSIRDILHNGYDVVHASLPGGERVAFHFIERDIDVALIAATLRENAAKETYTLFILWGAMLLPEHGEHYPPYDWMLALLTLYDDKIYGFEAEGERAWIYPVHFHPQATGIHRLIEYGETVNFAHLGVEVIQTVDGVLNGRWHIADFEDRPAARQRKGRDSSGETTRQRVYAVYRSPLRAQFDVLGVSLDADLATIRQAYRALAREFHPDLNPDPAAAERMKRINAAYGLIMTVLEGEAANQNDDPA
ncbi:MAG TPA: DnaJ domain-containing protein [Aggregatilineales bacterium]|nr:DnaJ domain-containing protein [Anaerolineales bacterium]HRE49612.1 DnaJ domain-containing protein [Aggregatilineales bacterium]